MCAPMSMTTSPCFGLKIFWTRGSWFLFEFAMTNSRSCSMNGLNLIVFWSMVTV